MLNGSLITSNNYNIKIIIYFKRGCRPQTDIIYCFSLSYTLIQLILLSELKFITYVNLCLSELVVSLACILNHCFKYFKSILYIADLLVYDYQMRLDFLFISKASWPEPSLSFWQKFNGHLLTIFQKFPRQCFPNLPFSSVLVSPLAARTLLRGKMILVLSTHFRSSVFPDSTPDHSNSPDSHTTETKPGCS